jgi:hypothetical protein
LQKWVAEMKNSTDVNKFADAEHRADGFAEAGADSRAETRAVSRAGTCAVVYTERNLRKRSVNRNRRRNKVVSQKASELSILHQYGTDSTR